ncbi:uncharacterized protein BDCG_06508 [Blastomyces dermatitidis ER-3]|nr:uncharacterized protein BDCG_06508 [Blastomyces dermatitidis ER-3]EEQ91388.2 hypothetical protein BDCG_06508 [Blastomyces dermatitidis ER-3]
MAELAEAGLDGGFGAQFRSTANLQPVTLASELALSINISIYHPSQVVNPGASQLAVMLRPYALKCMITIHRSSC